MSVGVKVGSIVGEVGASSFLNGFFSTIAGLLEGGHPGSRFPIISVDFYGGHVEADKVERAIEELRTIRTELTGYPSSAVIWDLEDRSKVPPWGDAISPTIQSMGDYFVSSTGRDLFELLFEAFSHALKRKRPVDIVEVKL